MVLKSILKQAANKHMSAGLKQPYMQLQADKVVVIILFRMYPNAFRRRGGFHTRPHGLPMNTNMM